MFATFIHHSGPGSQCISPGPPSGCHRYYVVHYASSKCYATCPLINGKAASLAGNVDSDGVFDRANGMLKACGSCAEKVTIACYKSPATDPIKCACPGSDWL